MLPMILQLSGHTAVTGIMQTVTCTGLFPSDFHHDMPTEAIIIKYRIFVIMIKILEIDNDLAGVWEYIASVGFVITVLYLFEIFELSRELFCLDCHRTELYFFIQMIGIPG